MKSSTWTPSGCPQPAKYQHGSGSTPIITYQSTFQLPQLFRDFPTNGQLAFTSSLLLPSLPLPSMAPVAGWLRNEQVPKGKVSAGPYRRLGPDEALTAYGSVETGRRRVGSDRQRVGRCLKISMRISEDVQIGQFFCIRPVYIMREGMLLPRCAVVLLHL